MARFGLCIFSRNSAKGLLQVWCIFVPLLVMGLWLLKVINARFLHCKVLSCHSSCGGCQMMIFKIHYSVYISYLEFSEEEFLVSFYQHELIIPLNIS